MLPVIASTASKESWTLSDKLGWHQKDGPRRELLVTIAKLHQGYLKTEQYLDFRTLVSKHA